MLRFLYLNIYSFLIVFLGILIAALPFYQVNPWIIAVQAVIAIKLFMVAGKMFSAWDDKKRKMEILIQRNSDKFRPDTFELFMQAPCGRLIAREVLRDLKRPEEYKHLQELRKPFIEELKSNCTPTKTVVYINEDFRKNFN